MRYPTPCIVVLALATQAHASSHGLTSSGNPPMAGLPGFLKLPLNSAQPFQSTKRQADVPISHHYPDYTVPLTFGTLGDTVNLVLDSGSQITWVNPDCSAANDQQACEANRVGKSSTREKSPLGNGYLQYGIGFADVDYYTDVVSLGANFTLQGQTFGIAKKSSSSSYGILGVGPGRGGFMDADNNTYIVNSLKNQGLTESRAFSLQIPVSDSSSGSIVFGGVDKKKFRDTLQSVTLSDSDSATGQVGFVKYMFPHPKVSYSTNRNIVTSSHLTAYLKLAAKVQVQNYAFEPRASQLRLFLIS